MAHDIGGGWSPTRITPSPVAQYNMDRYSQGASTFNYQPTNNAPTQSRSGGSGVGAAIATGLTNYAESGDWIGQAIGAASSLYGANQAHEASTEGAKIGAAASKYGVDRAYTAASEGRQSAERIAKDTREFIPEGGKLGEAAGDYYDGAFPGTNPWERLGASNPIGAALGANATTGASESQANIQAAQAKANAATQAGTAQSRLRSEEGRQKAQIASTTGQALQELVTRREIVQMQTAAQIKVAEIQAGVTPGGSTPDYWERQQQANETNATSNWRNSMTNQRNQEQIAQKIQAEIPKLNAEQALTLAKLATEIQNAHRTGHEADIRGKEAEWVHIMKGWGIAKDVGVGILTLLGIRKFSQTGITNFRGKPLPFSKKTGEIFGAPAR